jgi:hypothetical protein
VADRQKVLRMSEIGAGEAPAWDSFLQRCVLNIRPSSSGPEIF